jgi:large subunit ribosomal protein L23
MGLFTKTKKNDKKKTDDKTVKVDGEKKIVNISASSVQGKITDKKASTKDLYDNINDKTEKKIDNTSANSAQAKKHGTAYRILVKPLITEKATNLGTENKYVFEVQVKANKVEVKKAIKEVYGIEPISVNMIKYDGKRVRRGGTIGRKKNWKKAIVTLSKGKSINIYEGV